MDSLWLHYNHNIDDKSDSIEFHKYVDKITREIESDTAKQKSIRLAKELGIGFERFSKYIISDSNRYYDDIRNSFSNLPYGLKIICDSLDAPQRRFKAEDFYSKAFKVSPYEDEIGVVGFSKLLFNESYDTVILYYEFHCGAKCGFGEILILQRQDRHWVIKETHHLWIS